MNYYGKFHESRPGTVRPAGNLKTLLEIQNSGLSGHWESMGYPFDTPMWDGGVGHLIQESPICHDDAVKPQLLEAWWPYEQSAYLLDGLVRMGILTDDKEKLELFHRNLTYLLAHPQDNGILGRCYNESPSEWPMTVFFRAAHAYCRNTGDKTLLDALHSHYSALSIEQLSTGFRHINALEGVLLTYAETGDAALLEKAVAAYRQHNEYHTLHAENGHELFWDKLKSGRNFVIHGVSFSESVKIPVLLYLFTGNKEYLDGAETGLKEVLARHEQIAGLPSANEDFSGRDPMQGYETCTISDFSWALGYFLEATGKAEYADRTERIIYNALPGAVLPDFSALLYYSGANQVIASEYSNHSFYFRGQDESRQFSPHHNTQCCAGNIQRALPNFILWLWMLDAQEAPCAVMYGASVFSGIYHGNQYTIEEQTRYPEDSRIQFRFSMAKEVDMPFTFRIPAWCASPALAVNAQRSNRELVPGGFHTLRRIWRNADVLTLDLPPVPVQKRERFWNWFESGPLVYTLPVPYTDELKGPPPFCPHEMHPAGKWNYGTVPNVKIASGRDALGPFLKIPAYPVTGFDELESGRFTPEIPLFCRKSGPEETLILRPYGSAPLRLTAFPLISEKKILPVYQVKTSKPYPYDFRKSLPEQCLLPEYLSEKENLDAAADLQGDHAMYYNLLQHFGLLQHVLCYVFFRIWSETDGEAVFAVSASDGAQCFVNGQKYDVIEPLADGEFMAPFLFRAPVRKGFNLLTMKVCEGPASKQYRKAWGAKAHVFIEA